MSAEETGVIVEEIVENQDMNGVDIPDVPVSVEENHTTSGDSNNEFNCDDYLTIWIRGQLGLPDSWQDGNVKVSWSEIESAYEGMSDEQKEEKEKFWSFLNRDRKGRQWRYKILSEVLERHGLVIRRDSKLCRDFVFKRQGDKREIVRKMYMMKKCHENGAHDKFKAYLDELRQKNPSAVRPDRYVPLRDMFFDRFYQDFLLQNPEQAFHWVMPTIIHNTDTNEESVSRPIRPGTSRGRGGRGGFMNRDGGAPSMRGGRGGFVPRDGPMNTRGRGGGFRGRGMSFRGRGRGGMSD